MNFLYKVSEFKLTLFENAVSDGFPISDLPDLSSFFLPTTLSETYNCTYSVVPNMQFALDLIPNGPIILSVVNLYHAEDCLPLGVPMRSGDLWNF